MIGRSLIWLRSNWKFFTFGFLSIYPVLLLGYMGQEIGLIIPALGIYVIVLVVFAFANWSFLSVYASEDKPLTSFCYGLIVNSGLLLLVSLFIENAIGSYLSFFLFLLGGLCLFWSQSSVR